jgi:hypothetical protein
MAQLERVTVALVGIGALEPWRLLDPSGNSHLIENIPRRYNVPTNQTQLLVAGSPEGPFRPLVPEFDFCLDPPDWDIIDGTLYQEDGTTHMVFVHEWTQLIDGTMAYMPLSKDLTHRTAEPTTIFRASEAPWSKEMNSIGEATFGLKMPGWVTATSLRSCSGGRRAVSRASPRSRAPARTPRRRPSNGLSSSARARSNSRATKLRSAWRFSRGGLARSRMRCAFAAAASPDHGGERSSEQRCHADRGHQRGGWAGQGLAYLKSRGAKSFRQRRHVSHS